MLESKGFSHKHRLTKFNLCDTKVNAANNAGPETFILRRQKSIFTKKGRLKATVVIGTITIAALKPIVALCGIINGGQSPALNYIGVVGTPDQFVFSNQPVDGLALSRA